MFGDERFHVSEPTSTQNDRRVYYRSNNNRDTYHGRYRHLGFVCCGGGSVFRSRDRIRGFGRLGVAAS